jgi:hypothetical protein
MIPATPGPNIPEDDPEPEFRPEFFRNFEPSPYVPTSTQGRYLATKTNPSLSYK